MKRPTPEQLRLAAAWLRCNDGDLNEGTNCHVVAAWLEEQADKSEQESQVRRLARQSGGSVKQVKEFLRRNNLLNRE